MIDAMIAIAVSFALHSANVEMDEQIRYEQLAQLAESRQAAESTEEWYYEEQWYESDVTWDYTASYDTFTPEYVVSDGLNAFTGVNYYDGRRETYYSSNVLYHYRTGEWTLDDEGFYRTTEGYYVVAASDMEQGTTFEGSKGTCIVLDCGCADGTTDYYVAW